MDNLTMRQVIGIACLLGVLGGCGQGPVEETPAKSAAVEARVETLQTVQLPAYAVLPGTVVSADRVVVSSRVSGYIYNFNVNEGQQVKKDQLLFVVDPTGVKEQIRQAGAELSKAEAALAEAKDNFERFKNLYREQSATQADYQQAERNYKVAMGNRLVTQSALKAARAQLKYTEVRAPFGGLVVSKLVDKGQLSTPGMPVLVLESPDHLQIQVQVDSMAFAHLVLGQQIPIELETEEATGRTVTGQVERMVAAADPATHTHLVKIALPADSGAWSGKFVMVRIPVGEHNGIVVPGKAIYNRAGITGAFVVDSSGRAQFRMLTLGQAQPQGQVVLSGLFPGDRLIVSARGTLANGVKIKALSESHP